MDNIYNYSRREFNKITGLQLFRVTVAKDSHKNEVV